RGHLSAPSRLEERAMGTSSTSSAHSRWTGVHSPQYVAGIVPFGDDAGNLEAAGRFRALRLVLGPRDPAIAHGEPDNTGLAAT
ncbi:uncharacterized protein SCHCODRAFT_02505826, partial [Schizophyllum commune H4-8]|uniref:uncharacterized protein n=1 Tax=Schizophyllum commune (strain H4-8 / FGSC 9210) TaxID=578458 RepID=UPI00215E2755